MKKPSEVHEEYIARFFNGEKQPGSGNKWPNRGDIKTERFLISCKGTSHKQVILQLAAIDEIAKQSFIAGKKPLLCIRIQGRDFLVIDLEYVSIKNNTIIVK